MTETSTSKSNGDPVKSEHFEYRPTILDTPRPGARLREFLHHSPYFMIALAVNLTLVAVATVWKLREETDANAPLGPIASTLRTIDDLDKPKPDEVKLKDIFEPEDARVDTSDELTNETSVPDVDVTDQTFQWDTHFETANDMDGDTARGNSANDMLLGSIGLDVFSTIGVGGGSGRDGRRGYGTPDGGGRFNRLPRPSGKNGKLPRTELAVEAGLRWLARHQSPDGSWSPDGFIAQCQGGTVCQHGSGFGYSEYTVGTTGLALLAFLGAGYDHRSDKMWTDPLTNKKVRMGDVVRNGLVYLRERQQENGSLCETTSRKWGYNHSIATLAMCEAFCLSRAQQFKQCAQSAIDALIAGQNPAPGGTGLWGWRYTPQSGDNDISVTGWAVMALKSAELAGLRIAQDSLQGAYNFCEEVTDRTSGHVGYLSRADAGQIVKAMGKNEDFLGHPSFAAVGMCIRTFVKHNIDDPILETSAKLIARDLPVWDKAKKSIDYYYWYYASLALNQFDGPESPRPGRGQYWRDFEASLKRALLDNQVQDVKLCSDGSWDGDDRWGRDGGGRVYGTALNTLTFEVYYRYGNAFGTVKKAPKGKK